MAEKIPHLRSIDAPASLKEMAFQAIKKAIMNDQLEPGKLYSEPGLARELGISRTPVHEALIELASKGFLKLFPRRGFQINKLKQKEIRNLYSFRMTLETAVIREITPKITDELALELEAISRRQKRMAKGGNWMGFLKVDRGLHCFLASLTQNTYIISALENVRDLIDWTGAKILAERKERPQEAVKEHEAIISMLKKGDVAGAISKMEEHLKISEDRVLRSISQAGLPEKKSPNGKREPAGSAFL